MSLSAVVLTLCGGGYMRRREFIVLGVVGFEMAGLRTSRGRWALRHH
jgi:hypothetical protein